MAKLNGIERTWGTLGGQPRVKGSRIPVSIIFGMFVDGKTPAQIAGFYKFLTEEAVLDVLRDAIRNLAYSESGKLKVGWMGRPRMAELPKYAIFDDCDAPERRMIVELVGDKYRYMVPQKWQPARHRWMTPGRPPHGPTDVKTFGFETIETAHSVTFTRVCESAATYPDGKPRRWQDPTFGANIGDSFEIPRRKR